MQNATFLNGCLVLLSACSTPASDAPAPTTSSEHPGACVEAPPAPAPVEAAVPELAPTGSGDDYVFVWLRTGPATGLSAEETRAASAGHFANMDRLFAERFLLVAGPLGDPRAEPDHRGIFVFDVPTPDAAEELTRTDPAVQAGVFEFDAERFRTAQPLRELFRLEAEALANGTDGMRSYVIARCPDAPRAEAALEPLAEEGLVALSGRVGDHVALFVLVAETLEEAQDMLAFASEEELGWILSPWYGSLAIERFGREVHPR